MLRAIKAACGMWFRMMGSSFGAAYAAFRVVRLHQPIVTIFGGTHIAPENIYTHKALEFAALCAHENISILTGGGPGIMLASNCGAVRAIREKDENIPITLGIGVKGVDDWFRNVCAQVICVDTFAIRKELLINYSKAYVVFPGGVGTTDEFFEVLNLIKNKKISASQIVLIGTDYWHPIIVWFRERLLCEGMLTEQIFSNIVVTDDVEYAFSVVRKGIDAKK